MLLDTGTVGVEGEQVEPTLKPRAVRQLRKVVERLRGVMAADPATAPMLEQPVQHLLVHRSRQKIHPSLAVNATLPQLQPYQGADRVNLLNASVH